jgi:hypothetical protein
MESWVRQRDYEEKQNYTFCLKAVKKLKTFLLKRNNKSLFHLLYNIMIENSRWYSATQKYGI